MSDATKHWENIHSTKFRDVSWWQDRDSLWIDLIEKCQVPLSAPIIDVGAGASILVDVLLDLGYAKITLLDLSTTAVERMRSRLQDDPKVKFVVTDILDFQGETKFELWHDRAVFHFLTKSEEQYQYVERAYENTSDGAYLIISTFALDGPTSCSGLPIQQYDAESMSHVFTKHFDLIHSFRRNHTTPLKTIQTFTICIFQRR